MFGLSRIEIILLGALAGLALAAGAAWWLIDTGRDVERGKAAERTIEDTDDARKDREAAERRARDSSVCDSLRRLPGPTPADCN
jgi:hypothetical protein